MAIMKRFLLELQQTPIFFVPISKIGFCPEHLVFGMKPIFYKIHVNVKVDKR
jgi:hypothetical protein